MMNTALSREKDVRMEIIYMENEMTSLKHSATKA